MDPAVIGSGGTDPFEGFSLETRIVVRAAACGVALSTAAADLLAAHARTVLRHNAELHLTTITDPEEFLERHIGEGLEGAGLLHAGVEGTLLDLGSGNGYPAIPLAAARPGLRLWMTDASRAKAGFLRMLLQEIDLPGASVLEAHVQRPGDVSDLCPLEVLSCRAMGGWAKILPRFAGSLNASGRLLLWAGNEVETVATRAVWRKYRSRSRHPLPHRDQSSVWAFS